MTGFIHNETYVFLWWFSLFRLLFFSLEREDKPKRSWTCLHEIVLGNPNEKSDRYRERKAKEMRFNTKFEKVFI